LHFLRNFYNFLKGRVTEDQAVWVSDVFYRLALDANKDKNRAEGHGIVWLLEASGRIFPCKSRNYSISLKPQSSGARHPWVLFPHDRREIYDPVISQLLLERVKEAGLDPQQVLIDRLNEEEKRKQAPATTGSRVLKPASVRSKK
jgi:hypothetical protein